MSVKVIGLDIAKHVFQVHGADASGKAVLKKRLRREQLSDFFGSIPRCTVAMEATRGAHYWARMIATFGHEVKLISPQFVKPYVRGQKNDMQDAAAICEAASRPEMRFVPQKSIAQQDLQMLHRIRRKPLDTLRCTQWTYQRAVSGCRYNCFSFDDGSLLLGFSQIGVGRRDGHLDDNRLPNCRSSMLSIESS